jgi:ABC-type transport system involved in multi-copper enzyme maturation permease subunit
MLTASERRKPQPAMTFLPIVERELRVAARLAATYRNRTIAAWLVTLAALTMHLFGSVTLSRSQIGVHMFHTLSFLTLIFCALEGARKTADCLSEEKREGTLGLLFLTDLKGYDVVLGKLAGASLSSVYGLFAIFPVLSFPMLEGGVMPGEYWRMMLALVNILFFSLSAGMFVSACSRHESRAMAWTFALVAAFLILPSWSGIPLVERFSPAYAYSRAFSLDYPKDPQGYWLSLGIAQALIWLMLSCASVLLPRWWEDTPTVRVSWFRRRRPSRRDPHSEELRKEMLANNPAFWLAGRDSGNNLLLWILIVLICICGWLALSYQKRSSAWAIFGLAWAVNLIFKIRVAAQACHCLAEARRNNALEMLLATPLTVNEIISGQIHAIRQKFSAPVIALMLVEGLVGFMVTSAETGSGDGAQAAFIMICGIFLGLFVLDLVAVTWAGMWFGLTAKKESQALTKTVLLVLLLPYAGCIGIWFGIIIYIGVPIFWISWCGSKLKTEFCTIATQRYTPPSGSTGWSPAPAVPPLPPVIAS